MRFAFSDEQPLLPSTVGDFLRKECPPEVVRASWASETGHAPALWRQLAELGVLGALAPEGQGGMGLDERDLVLLLEETGRSLLPSPLLATTLAAAAISDAGTEAQRARWLPRLADGSAIGTVALTERGDRPGPAGIELVGAPAGDGGWRLTGEKVQVLDGGAADLIVVAFRAGGADAGLGTSDVALAVVARGAEGLGVENTPSIDLTRRVARLRFAGVAVLPVPLSQP